MFLSKRVKDLSPSSTLRVTSLANKLISEGQDVVSFAAGEPDFDTPDFIKEAAIEAIQKGFTKYTPSTGTNELKKAIQDKFKKDNGLDYSLDQIVVSSGAKHCIYNIIQAIIDDGDEVIIPLPYWVSYPEMVKAARGACRFVGTRKENNFKLTASELEDAVSGKTKLLILNSPSNPTGLIYSKDELKAIADVCLRRRIYVLSDEIYEKLVYDNLGHSSIAGFNKDIFGLTFTVNGVSKAYSMTGWRIGYCAGPLEAMSAIKNLQDHSTSNPCSIAQKATLKALTSPDDWTRSMNLEFQRRRDYLVDRIKNIPGIAYIRPQGAFYLFCDISSSGLKSQEFAMRFLDEEKVAVIPGDGFGCDDYIRLSFALNIDKIKKGVDRLEKWVKQLPKKS